jgi:hypothetical protein
MRVLILRTFAHEKVWDDRSWCEYEPFQAGLITAWDNKYLGLKGKQIEYTIGVYTWDYFYRTKKYGMKPHAFMGTNEEQIPSIVKLCAEPDELFSTCTNRQSIVIKYEFERKLWKKPNKELMFKLDKSLLGLKQKELGVHTEYPALSFTLEVGKVDTILDSLGIGR